MNYEINVIEKHSCFKKKPETGYYIKFGDDKPGAANYVESREYESFGDASIAAGILSNMLAKSDSVDVQHFEFFVRAALYVTDSPNKW